MFIRDLIRELEGIAQIRGSNTKIFIRIGDQSAEAARLLSVIETDLDEDWHSGTPPQVGDIMIAW